MCVCVYFQDEESDPELGLNILSGCASKMPRAEEPSEREDSNEEEVTSGPELLNLEEHAVSTEPLPIDQETPEAPANPDSSETVADTEVTQQPENVPERKGRRKRERSPEPPMVIY